MDIDSDYDMVSVNNVYIDNADEDSEASSMTDFLTDTLSPLIQNRYSDERAVHSKILTNKSNSATFSGIDTPKDYGSSSAILIIDSDSEEELSDPKVPQIPIDQHSDPWLNALNRCMYAQKKDSGKDVPKVTEKKSKLPIDDCVLVDDNSNSDSKNDLRNIVTTSPEADLGYCEGDDVDDKMSIDNGIHNTPTTTSVHPSTSESTPVLKSPNVGRKSKQNRKYYCTDCRAVFSEQHEHDRSVEEQQMKQQFTCDFCHEEFRSLFDYSRHGQSCSRRCTCHFCGHVFDEIVQLKQHLFTEHAISKDNASSSDIPTNSFSMSPENFPTCSFSEYSTFSSDLDTSKSEPVEQEELVNSTKFPCDICSSVFSNACNLKRHTTTKHPGQNKTRKRRKKGRFKLNVYKRQYMQYSQVKSKQVKAPRKQVRTGKQVRTKGKSTKRTVIVSQQQKTFTCDFCQKNFISVEEYSTHCKNCTIRCTCPFCGTTFQAMKVLRRHMFTQHDLSEDESESPEVSATAASQSSKYPCSECGLSLTTASNLQRHIRSQHHKSTKKRNTASKVKLKRYNPQSFKKHKGKQPTKTVKSETKSKSALSPQKKRKHTNLPEKIHKCDECGSSLSNFHNLKRHKKIHAKTKTVVKHEAETSGNLADKKKTGRFRCGICGDYFNHLFNLERHAMKHSEATPYQCQVCFTRFSEFQHLQCHFEKFHIMDS